MNRRKIFHFEFDDEGPRTLTLEYDGQYEQRLETTNEGGLPVLYVDRQSCSVLAKIFGKMALGSYEPGFHIHLEKDFNADLKEVLRIVLLPPAAEQAQTGEVTPSSSSNSESRGS